MKLTTEGFTKEFDFLAMEHPFTTPYVLDGTQYTSIAELYSNLLSTHNNDLSWKGFSKYIPVIYKALEYKFSSDNPELQNKLLATVGTQLININSTNETIWGVTFNYGKNILGKLITHIRNTLIYRTGKFEEMDFSDYLIISDGQKRLYVSGVPLTNDIVSIYTSTSGSKLNKLELTGFELTDTNYRTYTKDLLNQLFKEGFKPINQSSFNNSGFEEFIPEELLEAPLPKYLIAGGRDFTDSSRMLKALRILNQRGQIQSRFQVVSGMAGGADTCAVDIATALNTKLHAFPAQWDNVNIGRCTVGYRKDGTAYNKLAGFIRNEQMAEYADLAICFWDGKSSGTKHMIETMQKLNKPVLIVKY